MITIKTLAVASLVALAAPFVTQALAQAPGQSITTAAARPGAAATDMSNGEVRKIDKEARKITLKHGEIKNLGMPGMTMVFKVKDEAQLDKVQVGDQVRFKAESVAGAFVVTTMEPAI